jgi:phosphatidylglycerol:prolipoprotein diacylglycerol transferase
MSISGAIWYTIFNVLGYSAAGAVFYCEARRRKTFSGETLLYVMLGALVGALLGSKLGSALFVYPQYFWSHPWVLLLPQTGGKTLVGGIIGGYLGVVIAKKILKIESSTGDLFAPALSLGIAIGRIGCFLNGCCGGVNGLPVQLYESTFCLILFFVLFYLRAKRLRNGDLFKVFLLAYSAFRFAIEFSRADTVSGFFGLSQAQLICSIVFIWVAQSFLRRKREMQTKG